MPRWLHWQRSKLSTPIVDASRALETRPELAGYSQLAILGPERWLALPQGVGPRTLHHLRLITPSRLHHSFDPLRQSRLHEHHERIWELVRHRSDLRRWALGVETVFELGERDETVFVATGYRPGASLRRLRGRIDNESSPLSWPLLLGLLAEASRLLEMQHRAGYRHGRLSAAALRLVLAGSGPALQLCGGYPLLFSGQTTRLLDPREQDPVGERWELAAAVLVNERHGVDAMALAREGCREARAVLRDLFLSGLPAPHDKALMAYLHGGDLLLGRAFEGSIEREEVARLWREALACHEAQVMATLRAAGLISDEGREPSGLARSA